MIKDGIQFKTAAEIAEFVEQITQDVEATPCYGLRSESRFDVDLPADVQPLSEDFEPVGPPFQATVRDISASGIRVVHKSPVYNRFLAVVIQPPNAERTELIMKLLLCQRCADRYSLGGRFVTAGEESRSELP